MKNVDTVRVRMEGEVNTFWTLTYCNGATEEFESIDGETPRGCDEASDLPKDVLHFLDYALQVSGNMADMWNPDEDALTYTWHCTMHMVDEIEVQRHQPDGEYIYDKIQTAVFLRY